MGKKNKQTKYLSVKERKRKKYGEKRKQVTLFRPKLAEATKIRTKDLPG